MQSIIRTLVASMTVALALLISGSSAIAAITPYGIQSNVSQATVDSWGWTEIHRSPGDQDVNISDILSAATGDYLMMGVWDKSAQQYAILGAGETSVVTATTYQDYSSDNGGTTLNNWSNGINFYRTVSNGSWGFTSNTLTELNWADILLINGLQSQNGQTETVLSQGLSFHSNGSQLFYGWAYNTTGNDWHSISGNEERVFFTANADEAIPEPTTLIVWSLLGGLGIAAAHLRRRKAA
jgi:hypothetical protein